MKKFLQTKEVESKVLSTGFRKGQFSISTYRAEGELCTLVIFNTDRLMAACQMRHALIARGLTVTTYFDERDQVCNVNATYYPGIVAEDKEVSANEEEAPVLTLEQQIAEQQKTVTQAYNSWPYSYYLAEADKLDHLKRQLALTTHCSR